jgi:hypothetical protein
MHPYLDRLCVRPEIQELFAPFYDTDEAGNLRFRYGEGFEHYGLGFHRVPLFSGFWLAGNLCFQQVSTVIICSSAMEAIAWLEFNWHRVADSFSLLFFSAGDSLSNEQTSWLREHFSNKKIVFVLGNDLLGRLSAVKLAAGICGLSLQIAYLSEEKVQILFRGQYYLFSPENLSLNALEKLSGFRFRVIISTPKNHNSFFEQLKAAAGLSF